MSKWINSICAHLTSVDPEVFRGRSDPNDRRLGEVVLRTPTEIDQAEVVVVGCPQDEGVRRNQGRVGARHAPLHIRRALYRFPVSQELEPLKLADAGKPVPKPEGS